jgi:geranylgeranyl diphosphate synthase type II
MNDILAEGKELTLEDIEKIHISKTGALIKASVLSGAIIAKANKSEIKVLSDYAHNIGLAFQVTDDILNIIGDSEKMGKSVGTDSIRNKSTYPLLLGVDSAIKLSNTFIDNALCSISDFGENAQPLRAIAKYIINRKK